MWESYFVCSCVVYINNDLLREIDSHTCVRRESLRELILWFSLNLQQCNTIGGSARMCPSCSVSLYLNLTELLKRSQFSWNWADFDPLNTVCVDSNLPNQKRKKKLNFFYFVGHSCLQWFIWATLWQGLILPQVLTGEILGGPGSFVMRKFFLVVLSIVEISVKFILEGL